MNWKGKRCAFASTALTALVVTHPAAGQAIAGDAQAQAARAGDKADKADAQESEAIIVTGLRGSLKTALDIKRKSDQIVDSIVATDIGKLPDTNIVESLQRVAGVQIQRRYGEGSADVAIKGVKATPAVAIRGLTQVGYLFDGRATYSANGGRNLSSESFPPEVLAGIDVYKNPAADMMEGGIGGLVNFRTRLPFDQNWRLMYATGRANYYDLASKFNGAGSALYSNRWSTSIGEMGFLINPIYSNSSYRADSILIQPFQKGNPALYPGAPSNVRVPLGFQIYDETGSRQRFALSGAYQWQMKNNLLLTLQGLYAYYGYTRTGAYYYNSYNGYAPLATPGAKFTYAANGDVTSGSFSNNLFNSGRGDQELKTRDYNYTANLAWKPTHNLSIKFDAQSMKSHYDAIEIGLNLAQAGSIYQRDASGKIIFRPTGNLSPLPTSSNGFDPSTSPNTSVVNFDLRGVPSWTVPDQSKISDPSTYSFASIGNYRTENNSSLSAYRVDLKWDVPNSILKTVSAGARYSDSSITMRNMSTDWYYTYQTGPTNVWFDKFWYPNGNMFIPYTPSMNGMITKGPSPNFFNGTTVSNIVYPNYAPGATLQDKIYHTFATFGLQPRTTYYPADVNRQGEKNLSGYLTAKLSHEIAGMPVDVNLGLRAVQTKTTSDGYQFPSYLTYDPTNPSSLTPITANRTYWNVLPSLNMRAEITRKLQFRVALSKAMARPDFWQMGTNVTLGDPRILNPITLRPSGSSGNPFLNPIKSNQADASLEWYFAKAGSLTGAVFYKDVDGFLASGVAVRNINGIDYDISTTVNSGAGKIKGFEIGYSQFYDFLPGLLSGLGLQANYTFVDSNVQNPFATAANGAAAFVPLEKLSKNSFNVVGMYEKNGFSARLAYSWRSSYLNTTVGSGADGLAQYQAPYANLDASIGYTVSKRISVQLEAVNLNNRIGQSYIGTPTEPLQSQKNDRRFAVIVRAYY